MLRKILVADDDETNRLLLCKMLSGEYEVLEASDGKEALERLSNDPKSFSAVLLDIIMPELNGFEVLDLMRRDEKLSSIPVIVVTGSMEKDVEIKALSLGANDFVTKPFNSGIIKHRLRNTINLRETSAAINSARYDELTGLYSRNAFFELASRMISEHSAGYYVLACFDVDNFKVINDQYGAAKGDEVLRSIAKIFKTGLERIDGVCCRVMADNFAALYPRIFTDSDELAEIRRRVTVPDSSIQPISFSIGRYVVSDLTIPVSAMFDRATLAEASIKGRFDVRIAQYDESMRERLLREQEITSEMKGALEERQFEVWLQPQYNHSTCALIGAEALVRWRHPKRGLVSPDSFIPVFERNGFIYELDKYVWEDACALLRKWLDEGRSPLPISVNISRYDVFRDDLVDVLTGLTEKYGVPVELLRLEITESAFAKSTSQIISVVKRLMSLGFMLEIDDFGSGYSSLNTLKDVPADVLKLDMRFLENNENSLRGGNILESVVRMARWLGMSVIAEGVEKLEQADYLASIGCNYVQGYLYARPMTASSYEALAESAAGEEKMLALQTVETLDNNAFWDPKSMDTLIFNSYVGAACIFEYHCGQLELLRANGKYARVIGGEGMTMEDALKISWNEHIDPGDLERVREAIHRAVGTSEDVSFEAAFNGLSPLQPKTYLRVSMRAIARAGTRCLLYCTSDNITSQREAELRLRETDEQLRFLNDTAGDLLAQAEPGSGIESVLSKTLGYFGASRAFIYEYRYEEKSCVNTYEVRAPGAEPCDERCKSFPLNTAWFWLKTFKESNFFFLDSVKELGDDRRAEYEIYKALGVGSTLAVSLRSGGKPIGTMGVFDPTLHLSDYDRLAALGDYVSVILARRDLNARINSDRENLLNLMNDTPGGFARIRLCPDGTISASYVNESFCRMLGYSGDEAMRRLGENAMSCVHPDDVDEIADAVRSLTVRGEQLTGTCRLMNKNGGYIGVMIFGRLTENEAGERFLNLYFTDISPQRRTEELRKELLENLPCGAGIYELADRSISAVYLNKRHGELLGSSLDELQNGAALNRVHPDDRDRLLDELCSAIKDNRRGECAVRVKRRNGEYGVFHISGSIVERGESSAVVYVTFTPAADEPVLSDGCALKNEELLRLVVEHSARVIYRYNVATREAVSIAPEASDAMGLPSRVADMPESLISSGIIVSEDAEYVRGLFAAARSRTGSETMRFRVRTPDGKKRWLDVKYTFINENSAPTAAVISCLDITAQHEREVAFARYRQAADETRTGSVFYFETDITDDLVEKQGGALLPKNFNAVGRSHTRVTEELLNRCVSAPERDEARKLLSREHMLTLFADGQRELTTEWQASFADKTTHWISGTLQMVADPFTGHVKAFSLFKDVSEEKQSDLDIKKRAELDGMTGLLNRATAENAIRDILKRGSGGRCILLIIDLDDLKGINDYLGHPRGDSAIKAVAAAIKASFRKSDIVCRAGGDEFMVFMCDVPDESRLHGAIDALIKRVTDEYVGPNNARQLHCSVGGAFGSVGSDTFEALFEHADTALYHVKRNGKNSFAFYTPDMHMLDYKYTGRLAASSRRAAPPGAGELRRLLEAVASWYPLVASVSLTENSFDILEQKLPAVTGLPESGSIDALTSAIANSLCAEDGAELRRRFSHASLLAAHARGEASFRFTGRPPGDAGKLRAEALLTLFPAETGETLGLFLLRTLDGETSAEDEAHD